jgi:hypothetical protein
MNEVIKLHKKKSEAVVLGVDLMSLYSAIIPKNSR